MHTFYTQFLRTLYYYNCTIKNFHSIRTTLTVRPYKIWGASVKPVNTTGIELLGFHVPNKDLDLVVLVPTQGRNIDDPYSKFGDGGTPLPCVTTIHPVLDIGLVVRGYGDVHLPFDGQGVWPRVSDLDVEWHMSLI